jgi:hypothetical protein
VWWRSGFLCSRNPRSVAGRCVVEIVRSTFEPFGPTPVAASRPAAILPPRPTIPRSRSRSGSQDEMARLGRRGRLRQAELRAELADPGEPSGPRGCDDCRRARETRCGCGRGNGLPRDATDLAASHDRGRRGRREKRATQLWERRRKPPWNLSWRWCSRARRPTGMDGRALGEAWRSYRVAIAGADNSHRMRAFREIPKGPQKAPRQRGCVPGGPASGDA